MKLTVAELAERIGARLVAGPNEAKQQITAIGPVETAGESDVAFVADDKYIAGLGKSRAAAVIVGTYLEGVAKPQLVVKNVSAALIEALNVFAPELKRPAEGIDPTAKIGEKVEIGKGVSVGPWVVIDDGVKIGQDSVIASACKIGQNSRVGRNCRLDSNVVVYHNCCLGNNVVVQANTTIGSTGFGYAFLDGAHRLIPHNGGVVIEDSVEIGANCCIDRAKFGNTIIGAGTKIDNLVQVGHNVVIGKCCLIAGQVGIAGSCKLGDGVVLGGQAGLADNIVIGDGTMVGGGAGVISDVAPGQQVSGTPAIDRTEALRATALMRRLPKMAEQLKQLVKRVEKLEAAEDHKR
jgi:UDP-3-O-[3-hydroxymyristoyl] glucosamine N-acyltransferase